MRSLIYKDIQTLGSNVIVYSFLIFVVAGLTLFGKYSLLFGIMAMLLTAELSLGVWSMDIKSRWHKYCEALPFSRQTVVNEKFILILINSTGGILLIEACSLVGNLFRGEQLFGLNNALMLSSFFIVLAVIGVGLMLMILINYIAAVFLLACMGGLIGGLSSTAMSEDNLFAVEAVGSLSFLNNPQFHICLAAVCLIIFAVAWFVTVAVYKRKNI